MKKKKPWLSFFVIILALSVAFSFVAISHLLIETGKANPSANIDISASNNDGGSDSGSDNTESTASEQVKPEVEAAESKVETSESEVKETTPEVDLIGGKNEIYHKEIQIFYAEYGNDGEITVKSAGGDKVVAPGTENQYDLYVRNVGKVPISYILEAQSFLTVDINGEQVEVPVEASFSSVNNGYLLGAEDNLEHLKGLDGVTDSQGLSAEHQAKYTLCWSWPFDGNDEFDTLLGNLAAEGQILTVKVAFNVTASYDPYAAGGVPMTGDTSVIGIWIALFVVSIFTLIILLLSLRKKEQNEENSQKHKEKNQ